MITDRVKTFTAVMAMFNFDVIYIETEDIMCVLRPIFQIELPLWSNNGEMSLVAPAQLT